MIFCADFFFFSFFMILFSWFSHVVQSQAAEVMQGKTAEQIKEMIASSAAQSAPFMHYLTSFLIMVIGGILLLSLLTFLCFSLTQAAIWNHLLGQKLTRKNYWRWNLLHLVLVVPLLFYLLMFFIVKIIFGALFKFIVSFFSTFYFQNLSLMTSILTFLNNMVSFFLVIVLLLLGFQIYFRFTKEYKVWYSIGDSFALFKKQWRAFFRVAFYGFITILVVGLLAIPIQLYVFEPFLAIGLQLVLVLGYVAWLRIYFYHECLREKK